MPVPASGRPEVLFICDRAPSDGAPHHHMAAVWLAHAGFRVRCLLSGRPEHADPTGFDTPLGRVEAEFIGTLDWQQGAARKMLWHLRYCLALLKRRLKAGPGTVFYVQGHVACPAAWVALAGVPRARRVYQTQDYLEPGSHPVWAFFERRVARAAGQVLCNEGNRARFMASNYRLRATPATVPTALPGAWVESVAPLGRAELEARLGLAPDPQRVLILHQGPLVHPGRCAREILAALALLPERYTLTLTGNSGNHWTREARAMVEAAGLKERVHFLGVLPYQDLLAQTAAFDLGLLLYPNDGIGNFYQAPGRLTEYIGCGLPVVTSNFPGLELITLKHGLGRNCDPADPADIARAIAALGERPAQERERDRERLRGVFHRELRYEIAAPLVERIVEAAAAGA